MRSEADSEIRKRLKEGRIISTHIYIYIPISTSTEIGLILLHVIS